MMADRPVLKETEEIEITPEMFRAGARVLLGSGLLAWNTRLWVAEELARDMFEAMW